MSHKYLVSAVGSGVVIHETPEAGNSRRRHYVVVTDGGILTTVPFADLDGNKPLIEERGGDHPYQVTEHDRTRWVKWPGSVHQSPLYLDVHGPGGWHSQLLWDTVGFPWVTLHDIDRDAAMSPAVTGGCTACGFVHDADEPHLMEAPS